MERRPCTRRALAASRRGARERLRHGSLHTFRSTDWYQSPLLQSTPRSSIRTRAHEGGRSGAASSCDAYAYGQEPSKFFENPIETFKRHVWIAPFHEDSVLKLKELLGAENLLLGSDWPHAEGLGDPTDFALDLEGFTDDEVKMVMRDNCEALSIRRPV